MDTALIKNFFDCCRDAKKILELSPLVRYNDIDYCGCTSNPNMSVKQAGDKNE